MSLTSALAGRFFTTGATWEALIYPSPFPFGDSEIVFYVRKSVSVLYMNSFLSVLQILHISDII